MGCASTKDAGRNKSPGGQKFINDKQASPDDIDVLKILEEAEAGGQLEYAKMWQEMEIGKVLEELANQNDYEEIMTYLSLFYPSLKVFVLKHTDQFEQLQMYMDECKTFEQGDSSFYVYYLHGYLFPWFEQQRADNKIRQGKLLLSKLPYLLCRRLRS